MVDDARNVCGGVVVAAVTFANNHRQRLVFAVGEAIGEHHLGTVADFQHSSSLQTLNNAGQHVVVGAFTHEIVVNQQHTKACVHLVEVASAFGNKRAPVAQCFVVATLQQHHALTSTSFEII